MIKKIKKYLFLFAVVILNTAVFFIRPNLGITALSFTWQNVLNFLFMLTPVFICIGLLDVWVSREAMIKIMGENSGVKGVFVALFLGVVTAVPLYALLPVAGVLLGKGCKIFNVLIFLCSSASFRIPLLLFEVSSLGLSFTLARLGLNIIIVFAIAFLIEKLLTDADKEQFDNRNGL